MLCSAGALSQRSEYICICKYTYGIAPAHISVRVFVYMQTVFPVSVCLFTCLDLRVSAGHTGDSAECPA